jgi:hypothetical protein
MILCGLQLRGKTVPVNSSLLLGALLEEVYNAAGSPAQQQRLAMVGAQLLPGPFLPLSHGTDSQVPHR